MSCTYLVNGKWITEEQFKQVLNNGLLDSLIDSKTIALKGFPIDRKKIIASEKSEEISNRGVDARMLQQILLQEVKTRTGYPINMESALELNEAGTDFKISLWASPYASKFESILTSIVSNKIVKQKFPGNSYVLGSEEGFRIKEGKDANKELSKNGVIFSPNFDASKGLQPMRVDPETGKMLPAQIMIPFKFRDESGKFLDIKLFLGEDGRLDFNKIPEKVLSLNGFRIPTQEQNSMSSIEIVGFLPEASGDLMLAPRDFTRQMGSDFDVDKLYTYMYNTHYFNGKLHTNFEGNLKKIKAETKELLDELDLIKDELYLTKDEDLSITKFALRESIEEGEINPLEQILNELGKRSSIEVQKDFERIIIRLSVLKRSYEAHNQNTILDIHHQLLRSNNEEVVRAVLSLDTFGEFKQLAADIYQIRKDRELLPKVTTILSDEYQKQKYINATMGKAGVGNFSLDSTFNAITQGKNLFFDNRSAETIEAKIPASLDVNEVLTVFGDIESKGDLSNKYTLASQKIIDDAGGISKLSKEQKRSLKTKSLVIRSLQSSAVDNEKEQILDKLNINNETFDVIRALSLLGFDETDITGLLTQEIIWEYVEKLRSSKSSLNDYKPNVEESIVDELILKYNPTFKENPISQEELNRFSNISGKELVSNIKDGKFELGSDYNNLQIGILFKFKILTEVGKDIKKVQAAINTESKGVPKSLIETQIKLRQINNLQNSNIVNAESLLGEYTQDGLSKPTTISGQAAFYGTKTADKIYKNFFPYQKKGIDTLVEEIIFHAYGEEMDSISSSQQAKSKQEVFNEVKSYLFSSPDLGLTVNNILDERNRLFVDTDTNLSLATILGKLKSEKWYMENNFLNKLTPTPNKNGTLSRVFFEASTGENFDEKNIYLGFAYLFEKNISIGTFNDIEYTTRTLAQDLVLSAYLEGGVQGAKQYLKYIPTAYLKVIPFGNILGNTSFDFADVFGGNEDSYGSIKTLPSKMARQYFQNNPSKTKVVNSTDIENSPKEAPATIVLTEKARKANYVSIFQNGEMIQVQRRFISMYDKTQAGEYGVYEFDDVDRNYKRIATLSDKQGFKQYDISTTKPLSVIKKGVYNKTPTAKTVHPDFQEPQTSPKPIQTPRKDLKGEERVNDILNKLELDSNVSGYNQELLSIVRSLSGINDVKILVDNTMSSVGSYNSTSNTVKLNYTEMSKLQYTSDKVASTILHELIHSFSSSTIKTYNSSKRDTLSKEQIKTVQKLENLQKQYLESLVKEGNTDKLMEFDKFYWSNKLKNGKITQAQFDARMKQGPLGLNNLSEIPSNISAEDLSKYYGAIKLEEFVTMALTDQGFQQHLNNITDENAQPFWKKLLQSLIDLITSSLNITVNKDSLLPNAIEESLNLVKLQAEEIKIPTGQPTQPSTIVKEGIAVLRAREQKELQNAIPNITEYPNTYADVQGNMPDNLYAIYKSIYDKYNLLITSATKLPMVSNKNDNGPSFEKEITITPPQEDVQDISSLFEEDEFMTVEEYEKFKLLCKK